MSTELMTQFIERLSASKLLDGGRLDELMRRPEPPRGDVDGVAKFLESNGWLTRFQIDEIRQGRGGALVFGGYRLLERLPDPSGGRAYKAFHPALPQAVVVRWVDADWLAPADTVGGYVERARAACLVAHPHAVSILDAGVDGAAPFVVHEYVDGAPLDALVNEMGALPVPLACAYARQAAGALHAAHERGIIHGDFTPGRMLLTPVVRKAGVNGSGRAVSARPAAGAAVKVAELGLAPVRPAAGDVSFAQPHLLGAVDYLAPERLASATRDARADLYSFGASLYFLLAARPPFASSSTIDAMLQLQKNEPVRIETLRNDVPAPLAELIHRLLAKDPADRPAGASGVAEALKPYGDLSGHRQAEMPFAVPVASETMSVGNALPAILAQPAPLLLDEDPLRAPTVEPLPDSTRDSQVYRPHAPKVEPLSDHDHDVADMFGRHGDEPAVPRPRPKIKHGWTLLIFGILLHLIAFGALAAYLLEYWPFEKSQPKEDPPAATKDHGKPHKKRGG